MRKSKAPPSGMEKLCQPSHCMHRFGREFCSAVIDMRLPIFLAPTKQSGNKDVEDAFWTYCAGQEL